MPGWMMALVIVAVVALGYCMSQPAPPRPAWGCDPQPGHCDIDEDWYQTHKDK
jgi:hypothetical protein